VLIVERRSRCCGFFQYFHEIVKTGLTGRPFIMTATFPDPPKSVKTLMRSCFLKKCDNYLPEYLMTRSKDACELDE
jgi:hypothetical protein